MAFNPFHAFRKHQKVMFAGLTILCMLMFVMSAGVSSGGDAFSAVINWLGGRSRPATEVASLYGKSLDSRDILLLREQRRLANNFMSLAVDTAEKSIIEDLVKTVPDLDKQLQSELTMMPMLRNFAVQQGDLQGYGRQLNQVLTSLNAIRNSLVTANKTNEADKIVKLQDALQRDFVELRRKDELYPGQSLYFGGGLNVDGLLDFMIWKHEADRLGIHLTQDDIRREISRETWFSLSGEQASAIFQYLSGQSRASSDDLLSALGDEFRVRLARAALTGYDPQGFIEPPGFVSPEELWDFYRKNRTSVDVTMLPLRVEQFLSQVKDQPSKEELVALFEKHRDEEYAPFKSTPGFKQPRRVRVEWVETSPESEANRKAAHQWLLSVIAGSVTNPLQAAALMVPLANQYEFSKYNRFQIPGFTDGDFRLAFYSYASMQRPETVASALGQLAGALQAGGNPISPFIGLQGSAVLRESKALASAVESEARRRAPWGVGFLAAGAGGNPLLAAVTLAAATNPSVRTEQYLPLEVVKGHLIKNVEEDLAKDLVNTSFDNFTQELEKRKTQREQFVKEEIQRRGWKHGASEKLDDRYDIAGDPGLKALKEVQEPGSLQIDRNKDRIFAERFFADEPRAGQAPKLYAPQTLRSERSYFLYWKTQDEPAKVLSFDDAKPQVERAWRLEKARALAEAEAKKIQEECKSDTANCLANAAKRLGTKLIDLDSVSRLRRKLSPRAGFGDDYEVYRVPEEKIEYPAIDLVDQVLELKNVGETKVLNDAPISTYYVTALSKRVEPTVRDFEKDTASFAFQRMRNTFLAILQDERRTQYRKGIMDQLRAQARLNIDTERRSQVEERANQ
jgi:hypothetical protein